MSKRANPTSTDSRIGPLIERLGPYNNVWRDGAPAEKVAALWEMGDALLEALPNPTDAVLWEIQKRSYITRNLLRYALIIRRSWEKQDELLKLTKSLRNYTVFREALPFLKGDREGIDEATYKRIVELLRSTDSRKAISFLKELKSRQIGRHHKKGSGAASVKDQAITFRNALAQLESAAADSSTQPHSAPDHLLVALSRAAMNIASGDMAEPLPAIDDATLSNLVLPLTSVARGGRSVAAAFRKAVGAETLMRAADLLNSMRSEAALAEWRRRRGASLSL